MIFPVGFKVPGAECELDDDGNTLTVIYPDGIVIQAVMDYKNRQTAFIQHGDLPECCWKERTLAIMIEIAFANHPDKTVDYQEMLNNAGVQISG